MTTTAQSCRNFPSPSLWEKSHEEFSSKQQDTLFADDENHDSPEDNPTIDGQDECESRSDTTLPIEIELKNLSIEKQFQPWETSTNQDYLMIIINNECTVEEVKQIIKGDFSKQGLKWADEEENMRQWYFGLTSIQIHFTHSQSIDIPRLSFCSRIPFWMALKKEKQQPNFNRNQLRGPIRHELQSDCDVSLSYGALIDVDQFFYSPEQSWKNDANSSWSIFMKHKHNDGSFIQWQMDDANRKQNKQLLISNIDHTIIVTLHEDGFDMYICQKCNMNELKTETGMNNNIGCKHCRNASSRGRHHRSRDAPKNCEQHQRYHRSSSRPRSSQLLGPKQHEPRQNQKYNFERIGVKSGCYFSTIQFSMHRNPLRIDKNINNRIKQIFASLMEFFVSQRITVCYGNIVPKPGPIPYLFFQPQTPDFPSLIMRYSWQMLSIVGYRLQIQIANSSFIAELHRLSEEPHNPDELFYRVCVYLSRILSLKPFVSINQELQHAITESRQKRNNCAYGLISKIDIKVENEAYIPSVTLTPTTIRIKPLKLCRTNRVLRAIEQFGQPLYHFVLVDIRDENGRHLQSYHFRHLKQILIDYLKNGFQLMDDNRQYKYLHHSRSQLRGRQFWFYHHHHDDTDPRKINPSFSDAYQWMGNFENENNPAKYAARMALCFTSTIATVQVPGDKVLIGEDIEINVNDRTLLFTDGCGTMSVGLRDKIKNKLCIRDEFSAVQFRYNGAKGVVSISPDIKKGFDLFIRPSMNKFKSAHRCFEKCKISAPRTTYLNRQAILLLSYRKISDCSFLILQQQNHLILIRCLLRNSDAEKLIIEKIPRWFLPADIHIANIDYIHEPFFRQLIINGCLQSTRDLLQRTRIRIPPNKGRNMFGIADEYKVLKADEVFIQYTILYEVRNNQKRRTEILDQCKVVITKNPCHHPGDIRTFTAVNYPQLRHLKDVVVFSQQGDRPAPHDISGSDLDGDEYLVLWHEDLVPNETENAQPYDYDALIPNQSLNRPVERDDINEAILRIAEQDALGRLSKLHLAFADKFGVDNAERPAEGILSTIELAGAISQEVDSGTTGHHPLSEDQILKLNDVLNNERPDFMDNPSFKQYQSPNILGKLFRASKKTLRGWNQLLRYYRHLRHLQVQTQNEPIEGTDDEEARLNDEETKIEVDQSLLAGTHRQHPAYEACAEFANKLVSVYRQEIFEILNLYGLSHESDLWCRNSINGVTGELEDTAYTELEQLVKRTRTRFFNEQIIYCETGRCNEDTPMVELCNTCRQRKRALTIACYDACYGGEYTKEQMPILSLPWLFAESLLQDRLQEEPPISDDLLSMAMKKALDIIIYKKRRLQLYEGPLKFHIPNECLPGEANIDLTACAFIEILEQCIGFKEHQCWPWIVSRFIRNTPSFTLVSEQLTPCDEWKLILQHHRIKDGDIYAAQLISIEWNETTDHAMYEYFDNILDICFEAARKYNDIGYLDVSEYIILLLQKMAINETII
ncbi:unnamed protein product [Rotaria socialis]